MSRWETWDFEAERREYERAQVADERWYATLTTSERRAWNKLCVKMLSEQWSQPAHEPNRVVNR